MNKPTTKKDQGGQDAAKRRYLSTVTYSRGQRSDKLVLTECVDGEKAFHLVKRPTMNFFVDKEGTSRPGPEMFVPASEVDVIRDVNYREMGSVMAELAGRLDWFKAACAASAGREAERELHQTPSLHQTDVHIEDYYIGRYLDTYSGTVDLAPRLHKAFWDIEVDSYHGNPFDTEGTPCPVDAVSLYSDRTNAIYTFLLRNEDNPQVAEFEKGIEGHIAEANGRFGLSECQISFHETDVDLLRAFFETVNTALRPDTLASWNQHYDFVYSMNRIKNVTRDDPGLVMCPPGFPLRKVFYYDDKGTTDWSFKADYAVCAGYTNYVDQLITYANLRATLGKKDAYDLNSIAEEELGGCGKDPVAFPIREFSRKDYPGYVFNQI